MKIIILGGLGGRKERSYRILEMKWFVTKHDVAKFAGHHAQCKDLRESGTSDANVIAQALYLFQHQKCEGCIVYLHALLASR